MACDLNWAGKTRFPLPSLRFVQMWYAQPTWVELFQTTCVKCPVADENPGLLKSY